MKIFCLVFSLYILFLSVQPCEEMTANIELRADKVSATERTENAEKEDEKSDDCSPFCVCACCHFATADQFETFAIGGQSGAPIISKSIFSYRSPDSQTYKKPVWQPPKFNSIA
ncbi:MAG TPA: DUF6660 family protein [Pyrinomonadaceae bacterium]|jgi:hypothetical protein